MNKRVKIILSLQAEEVYNYLVKTSPNSKIESSILNAFNKKKELIKVNIHYGQPINKKLIPKEYIDKYDIKNLFRVELPNFWRMFYTLTNDDSQIEIIAFVIEIFNHNEYDKRLGYN